MNAVASKVKTDRGVNDTAQSDADASVEMAAQRLFQRLLHRLASNWLLSTSVLLLGLGVTAALYIGAANNEADKRAAEVARIEAEVRSNLLNRLQAYFDTLPGLRALCLLEGTPNDAQFARYIEGISLQRRFPGLAVTFIAQHLRQRDLAAFERAVAADRSLNPRGHPGFKVRPDGQRAEYMVLRHLDPSNTPSLGYDLYDPAAGYRAAAEAAVRSDQAIATAPLLLAHNRDQPPAPELTAVVVRLPVYAKGVAPRTEAERTQAIWGLVGVSFRTLDLVRSVLPAQPAADLYIKIVDTGAVGAGKPALIFDSGWLGQTKALPRSASLPPLMIDIGTRQWALTVDDQASPSASWLRPIPLLILAAGLTISLLFAALTQILVTANKRARLRVERATHELIRNQRNLEEAQRLTQVGFFELDIETKLYTASTVVKEFLGIDPTLEKVPLAQYLALIHPDDAERVARNRQMALDGVQPLRVEYRIIRPDGEIRHLDGHGFVTFDEQHKPIRYSGAVQDVTERKRAEEVLRASESLLRIAGGVARLGGWSLDLPPTRVVWSEQVCAILEVPPGFSPTLEEAISYYAEECRDAIAKAVAECVADGKGYDAEHQVITAKGNRLWVRAIGEAVRDAAGKVVRIQGAFQDISERKRDELALASANRSLQMLTRCNEALIRAKDEQSLLAQICRVAVDVGGYRLAWVGYAQHDAGKSIIPQTYAGFNEGYLATTRLSWAEINQGPAGQAIRNGKLAIIADFNKNAYKVPWLAEANARALPGVVCLPLLDKTHTFGMLALYPPEVREFRESELQLLSELAENLAFGIVAIRTREALREREERFKNLARATSDGVWDCNLVTDVIWRSEGWGRMLGFTQDEVGFLHETWSNQLHPDDREKVLASVARAIDGSGEFWTEEYRMLRKDGAPLHVADRAYISRDTAGKALRMVGGMSDITDRRQADALRADRNAAELASRSKSEFLARMSHELRTPLNSILGFAQLMQYSPALQTDAPAQAKLVHILASGKHLVAMIDDILDLSRIESGALALSLECVEISQLIADCIAQTAPQAAPANINIVFDQRVEPHWIRADRTRVRQIILNLLSNAIKYNRDGGSVEIRIGESAAGERVFITVCDSGHGLTPGQLDNLFQPFNRLGAENGGIEGTGIGLVIVKQLVGAMDGTITVSSAPELGSTFTLTFPRAPDNSLPVAAFTSPPPSRKRDLTSPVLPLDSGAADTYTVLYIEDNPGNVSLMQEALKMAPGVCLEIAVDGIAGLAAAKALQPDLILLDINLPGMDGFAVLNHLRADRNTAQIPCLALSANAMRSEIARALEAGFIAYLTKPLDVELLLSTIGELLTGKKSA